MSVINGSSLGLQNAPDFISGLPSQLTGSSAQSASGTSPYSALYAFGDSLSDGGNIAALTLGQIPASPYQNGVFSNGPVWVQDLAASFGLPGLDASVAGGNDFAFGSAKTGASNLNPVSPADLPTQLALYQVAHPSPQANALYTLSIGGNDVLDAIGEFTTDPVKAQTAVTQAVANETGFIQSLADQGARNFVVMNVPDLSKIPSEVASSAFSQLVAKNMSAAYDYYLNVSISDLVNREGLNIHVLDSYNLIDAGIANPAAYGLTNVSQPLWSGNFNDPASGTLAATGAAAGGYLFFDGLHPTATGHAILAAAAQASLQPVA